MTKILLVEDNEMNQDMLTRRLLRRGYEIVCAMDGKTGVDMAFSESPDLILMDMSLPIMDGWEATRVIKADDKTRSIPIIALTAHAMVGDRQKSMEAGCDDYDTKPVELARLLAKIETLLASCQLESKSDHQSSVEVEVKSEPVAVPKQVITPTNLIRSIDITTATILIVDDIEENRDMLGRRLQRAGYTVVLAEGGRQGLDLIEQQQIDLVLLDIMMPDFNGLETLTAIRTKYSMVQLPVIMATAKDRSEDMLQAFELGANDYVTKPIDLPIVLARIQSHLRLIQSAVQEQPIQFSRSAATPTLPSIIEPIAESIEQPIVEKVEPKTLESATGLCLERYKISQQLVRDDVQNIYLAQDTTQANQTTYLIRQIQLNRERPSLTMAAIHQFNREVEIFKQLSLQQNIISTLEGFQQEQKLYIVQEYIGEDLLATRLKLERSVGIATALTAIVEMLEILRKLHQCQLFHQYLGPNCFAYDRDGKLVLIDLGIAARLSAKINQIMPSSQNVYQTPVDWGNKNTASTDIYTVGSIVIHALTGISPDLIPLDPVTGELMWRDSCIVAQSFAKILNKAISKNTDDRYDSIDTMLEDIYRLPMVSTLLKRSPVSV